MCRRLFMKAQTDKSLRLFCISRVLAQYIMILLAPFCAELYALLNYRYH